MTKEYCVADFVEMIKKSIKSYRRPSGYYYNNRTNKEHWRGAKQGWKNCIDYIVDWGGLDDDFEKVIMKIIKYYSPETVKEWNCSQNLNRGCGEFIRNDDGYGWIKCGDKLSENEDTNPDKVELCRKCSLNLKSREASS